MESRQQRILHPLLQFFSHEVNFKPFIDTVVLKTRNIPLRLLDWFVTNYSKKMDVSYVIQRPTGLVESFHVFRSYRAQLKGSKKKEFDPFCRGNTITLEYLSTIDQTPISFETAICQLKFFKWAIENLVLDYVESHFNEIYDDMKNYSSKAQKTVTTSGRRKKTELSKSCFQQLHISTQPIIFNFAQKLFK